MTIQIVSGLYTSSIIENVVRVLDVFNEANEAKPLTERIDYKEFYNDAINKDVSLKEHFKLWIDSKAKAKALGQPFNRKKIFSFCCFSWIMDAASKADLLKFES